VSSEHWHNKPVKPLQVASQVEKKVQFCNDEGSSCQQICQSHGVLICIDFRKVCLGNDGRQAQYNKGHNQGMAQVTGIVLLLIPATWPFLRTLTPAPMPKPLLLCGSSPRGLPFPCIMVMSQTGTERNIPVARLTSCVSQICGKGSSPAWYCPRVPALVQGARSEDPT